LGRTRSNIPVMKVVEVEEGMVVGVVGGVAGGSETVR
jgi:hypothetical protein